MSESSASPAFVSTFCEAIVGQLGKDNLKAVLEKAELPVEWSEPIIFQEMNQFEAANAYSGLQQAMRTYYGRGARGVLMRVGSNMWIPLLNRASLAQKTQAVVVRRLPVSVRYKPVLDLVASMLGENKGDVTIHTLDMDLLLSDHVSPGTLNASNDEPICYVPQGLIREALYWATGFEHDIEEVSCRATGEETCEFKIATGRK